MTVAERVYSHLPVWAQHTAFSAYGCYWRWLRFGPGYGHRLEEYRGRDGWSEEQWRDWSDARLRCVLDIAADRVPYYRDTWGPETRKAARAGRLQDLPLLEKQPLRAQPDRFCREDVRPRPILRYPTSGSTGTPIESRWTVAELRGSLALREARSTGWAGTSFSRPRATFHGRLIEPDPESSGPFYRYNAAEKQVYYSAFHLSPSTVSRYVRALHRHRVEWLTGYAASLALMARYMLEQDLAPPPLSAIVTTSEQVTAAMRETMQRAFGCRVFEEYSTVENVLFGSECEAGSLHVSPDAGVVEILRTDGSPCRPGEVGEVVATCLLRSYQPFVRFRLGDLAAWAEEPCRCGRAMPVLREVVGRVEDAVVTPDGRRVVQFYGVFVGLPEIHQGQIIQERLDRIRVRLVAREGLTEGTLTEVARRVRQRLGAIDVDVETVEALEREPSGKFRSVVSRLAVGGERTFLSGEGEETPD